MNRQERSSVFEAEDADFIQERFVGHAELLGRAGLIPLRGLECAFNFEALDVLERPRGDLLQRATPVEIWVQHFLGDLPRRWARSRKLQLCDINLIAIRKDGGGLDRVLQFADILWPGVGQQRRFGGAGELEVWFAEFAPKTL